MHPSLIERKLRVPPPPARVARRPRLDALLASLLRRHRVVVVAATAGAGKTTAVAEAVRGLGGPAAWLTVDGTDAAPGRLLAYLEASVGRHVARGGKGTARD